MSKSIATRLSLAALLILSTSSSVFARNMNFGPTPPPPLEDGLSVTGHRPPPDPWEDALFLNFGPTPPPPLEDGLSVTGHRPPPDPWEDAFSLNFGPTPPPPLED